jgi:hypothetical protein
MAIGEDEAVAVRPLRIRGIVPQIAIPQDERYRRQSHRGAWMPAVGFLHRVHGQRADGVDSE